MIGLSASLMGLSVSAVGLRVYARRLLKLSFGIDDWLMIPALVGLRLRGSSSVAKHVSDIRLA